MDCYTVTFEMFESGNLILVTPGPVSSNLKPEEGIAADELAEFILKVFNLPYDSDGFIQSCKLPKILKVGDVVTNAPNTYPQLARGWQQHIVVFVGKNGVNIICLKAAEGRMEGGLPAFRNWLENNLYEKDEKTLVERPKGK